MSLTKEDISEIENWIKKVQHKYQYRIKGKEIVFRLNLSEKVLEV